MGHAPCRPLPYGFGAQIAVAVESIAFKAKIGIQFSPILVHKTIELSNCEATAPCQAVPRS